MKKYLLSIFQVAVTATIFIRIFGNSELRENALRALAEANLFWLAGAVCVAALGEILCATRWWIVLKAFGLPLRWRDAVAYSAIGLFYSLGLPGSAGGDAMRTIYIIKNFPKKKMASAFSVLADRLCGLMALVIFMVVSLVWNRGTFFSSGIGHGIVISAAGLLAITILLLGLWWVTTIPKLRDFVRRRHPRFSPHLLESGGIFGEMFRQPKAMAAGCGLAVVALAAHFMGYFLSAIAFDSRISIGGIFSIMPVVDTLTMLPVALYGLGLREALFVSLMGIFFGTPPGVAALISLGGFSSQAVVALSGILFLPFTKLLGSASGGLEKN